MCGESVIRIGGTRDYLSEDLAVSDLLGGEGFSGPEGL